jgi:hypothetical protein
MDQLDIGAEDLEPGGAEVTVSIPLPAVRSELQPFGQELVELQRIFGPFLEVGTGSRPQLSLRSISSSDFTLFIVASPLIVTELGWGVKSVLDVYKTLLEIRKLRSELKDAGASEETLAAVDRDADSIMDRGLAPAAEEIVASAQANITERKAKLKIEVRASLNALANRIDKG